MVTRTTITTRNLESARTIQAIVKYLGIAVWFTQSGLFIHKYTIEFTADAKTMAVIMRGLEQAGVRL